MAQTTGKFSFKKVVSIEDSKLDQFIIEHTLQRCKFSEELLMFSSAGDALSHFAQVEEKMAELPDLIFLDIQMPLMNGFEFLTMFNEKYADFKDNVSVVLLTSSLDPVDMRRCHEFPNIKLYLNKPLREEMLNEVSAMMC